ncbi:MAG TPA: carboxymuconolactone decarboxylase family protein [Solirubrobacteraceae bacterium]|jgi:alkylhydroperoxidase family enzyme|nr:carboxymuconolactone decarboxylase family protein [Solirubrobacteraceae bacterium]
MTETAAATPRIAPLEPPYDPDTEEMLRKWMPPGSPLEPLALFRTLAVHDELVSRMRPLGAGILGHGRVAPRERELVIHRTCARAGAEYEWGVHAVAFGAAVGLSDEELAATAVADGDDPVWSKDDALLIRLADELHETGDLSDPTWAALAERFTDDQLLELIITAGWYRLLSYVINVIRITPEPWAARFPNDQPASRSASAVTPSSTSTNRVVSGEKP